MKLLTILLVLLSVNTFAGDYGQDTSKNCTKIEQSSKPKETTSNSSSEEVVKAKAARK